MPELPEVETVRRQIEAALIGWTIDRVHVRRADVVTFAGPRPTNLRAALLEGQTIDRTARHGKQLAIISGSGAAVRVHLGMSGTLTVIDDDAPVAPHTHIIWELQRGGSRRSLHFRDPRRFGGLLPFRTEALLLEHWSALGPDALHITARQLRSALRSSRRPLKAALLDQAVLAGVGNIYADEALHTAGMRPTRECTDILAPEFSTLATSIRRVLASAIRHRGSSVRDYRGLSGGPGEFQSRHKVYGRGGLECLTCRSPLESMIIAQRTTVFCPKCQK